MTLSLIVTAPNFASLETPLLVVALGNAPTLTDELKPIDNVTGGALGRALSRRDFREAHCRKAAADAASHRTVLRLWSGRDWSRLCLLAAHSNPHEWH